ncbi:hypothetical protein BGX26_010161 [Mortierella sp. AD094]|nr:hypothetical protein BGX26_010161 [Mortierella sp. AD094]
MVLHTALFWLARQNGESNAMKTTATMVTGIATNGTTGFLEPNHATLSSIAGMLSILCWFIVLIPKSGESVSLPFLYIWLMGDLLNLLGATIDDLLLTMFLLIGQVYYYRRMGKAGSTSDKNSHDGVESTTSDSVHVADDEETALLGNSDTQKNNNYYSTSASQDQTQGVSWSSTDHPAHSNGSSQSQNNPSGSYSNGRRMSTASERARELFKRRRVRQALMILLPALATAFLLWTFLGWSKCVPTDAKPGNGFGGMDANSDNLQAWGKCGKGHHRGKAPSSPPSFVLDNGDNNDDKNEWLGVTLGWGSAILYLGSRTPQIYKNWRLQSCEGLSILMFMFSVLGNVFYVASIFLNSMDRDYLIQNMPWWLGSGGTLIFDFMIFGQFYLYRHNTPLTE